MLSCILQAPTVLDPSSLVKLSRESDGTWLSTCVLETVASVENPFVAGVTLSVAFAKAVDIAPQGEPRKLRSIQNKLDNLLLEISLKQSKLFMMVWQAARASSSLTQRTQEDLCRWC